MIRPPLNEILNVRTGNQEIKQCMKLTFQYDYTLKDIAEYIGVHYTTVSRAIKKIEGNIKSDIARPDPLVSKKTDSKIIL